MQAENGVGRAAGHISSVRLWVIHVNTVQSEEGYDVRGCRRLVTLRSARLQEDIGNAPRTKYEVAGGKRQRGSTRGMSEGSGTAEGAGDPEIRLEIRNGAVYSTRFHGTRGDDS